MGTRIFTVKLTQVIEDMHLQKLYFTKDMEELDVSRADVNRPGLQIIGFFDYFDPERLQIFGKVENTYLANLTSQERYNSIDRIFSCKIPAAIITRHMEPCEEMLELAKLYNIPLLRTEDTTSRFMSRLISSLNLWLAPRITCHGVLVEVYGEGILILGESGVGKSETAVELLKRGHRLVADDAVEVKMVSTKTLVGSSPDIIRHFIEIRGIGIIDVKNIFGMGAVKDTEKLDLIIQLVPWDDTTEYDRLGLETTLTTILDVEVPSLIVPVKPGRNLAVIMEVAAMNNRQKRMGYNAAEELNKRLMANMEAQQQGMKQ